MYYVSISINARRKYSTEIPSFFHNIGVLYYHSIDNLIDDINNGMVDSIPSDIYNLFVKSRGNIVKCNLSFDKDKIIKSSYITEDLSVYFEYGLSIVATKIITED